MSNFAVDIRRQDTECVQSAQLRSLCLVLSVFSHPSVDNQMNVQSLKCIELTGGCSVSMQRELGETHIFVDFHPWITPHHAPHGHFYKNGRHHPPSKFTMTWKDTDEYMPERCDFSSFVVPSLSICLSPFLAFRPRRRLPPPHRLPHPHTRNGVTHAVRKAVMTVGSEVRSSHHTNKHRRKMKDNSFSCWTRYLTTLLT